MAQLGEPSPPAQERDSAPYVSPADCIPFLEDLSNGDLGALKGYATYKMLGVRGAVFHTDADDLVHEAIARTMDGRRRWNLLAVDFVTHLKGCIRSIANELLKQSKRDSEQMREINSREADVGEDYSAKQILDRIRLRLQADAIALNVFDRLRAGDSPAEVRQTLNIDANVYNAARKRIYRTGLQVVSG